MIVGALLLVMDGDPYFGPPLSRATMKAVFTVQVSNVVSGGGVSLEVRIQHRNLEDTSWGLAGTFSAITAVGDYNLTLAGLKELVRYTYVFTAGDPTDGMYVIEAAPQWLND